MADNDIVEVVGIREETSEEKKLREWFEGQAMTSLDNLEAAARLLIGLVTGLLGVLFGVLTLDADPLPAYLKQPLVQLTGVVTIAALLAGLIAALFVVLPNRFAVSRNRPDEQRREFNQLRRHKSWALNVAAVAFGAGLTALAVTLIAALLYTGTP